MKTIQQMSPRLGFSLAGCSCAFRRGGWRCERESDSDDSDEARALAGSKPVPESTRAIVPHYRSALSTDEARVLAGESLPVSGPVAKVSQAQGACDQHGRKRVPLSFRRPTIAPPRDRPHGELAPAPQSSSPDDGLFARGDDGRGMREIGGLARAARRSFATSPAARFRAAAQEERIRIAVVEGGRPRRRHCLAARGSVRR